MSQETVDGILTLRPGGHVRVYFATFHDAAGTHGFMIRTTLKAAQHTAVVWGSEARAASQVRVEWDDGAEYREPWMFHALEHEESSCPTCGIMMS